MSPVETLRIAVRAIRANLLRSTLTMLGIIIGVAAVIAMVAIGNGAQRQVAEQIRMLGSNLLLVQPGAPNQGGARLSIGARQTLTEEDAVAVASEVPRVLVAAPMVSGSGHVVQGNLNWSTLVTGITPDFLVARDWRVESGRSFTQEDIDTAAKVVLLGRTVADTLFRDEDPIGRPVRIANVPLVVVGVLGIKGQNAASGRDQDDIALVPLSTAKLRVLGANRVSRNVVDFLLVKVAADEAIAPVQQQIRTLLRQRHRLTPDAEDDFRIREPFAAMEARAASTRSLTFLLSAVASVSLVVGGISIMNIMLVSVTERTREIGLRQALGARRRNVRNQFLVEAATLCVIGGVAGVLVGIAAAFGIAALAGWPIWVSPASILLSVAVAGVIGVFFGFYPAHKASHLDPIEALRFE
ncbi:ABC transporter permease [Belnapia rosea]|uniref:ABC transporter permease n=1 Tax=Belnapia rosea TaxID=938405 RepID=UPI00088A5A87|nr:ABC transporter permease [Belnapia rosea]SDB74935.1 putative ABC transport system permease protein [Belnapia rosea]